MSATSRHELGRPGQLRPGPLLTAKPGSDPWKLASLTQPLQRPARFPGGIDQPDARAAVVPDILQPRSIAVPTDQAFVIRIRVWLRRFSCSPAMMITLYPTSAALLTSAVHFPVLPACTSSIPMPWRSKGRLPADHRIDPCALQPRPSAQRRARWSSNERQVQRTKGTCPENNKGAQGRLVGL